MNFRECRMVSLHGLMDYACDGKLSMEDTFLMLGGIRNSIYYFHVRGMEMIGTGGTEEINCPGIFDVFDISYETITAKQFENEMNEGDVSKSPYFYIIPVMGEMINKPVEELEDIGTFGQSFFLVNSYENGRAHFYYPIKDAWVDVNVLKEVEKDKSWVVEAEFCIYKIDKKALKENKVIHSLASKSREEHVLEVLKKFNTESVLKGDAGTIRIDGPEAYDRVIDYFEEMKSFLNNSDDKKRKGFLNYIYLQMIQFRKFMLSGTDGYYRSEFNVILHQLYGDNEKYREILSKWDELETSWRNIGRVLSKTCTYNYSKNHPVECINSIEDFWKDMRAVEPKLVEETISVIESAA